MTDPNYQHMRQIAEGAVDLAIAGAPEVDVEAEGLIRVSIRRLDIGGDGSALDAVLNDLTADVEHLREVFNAWARDDAPATLAREVEQLKERLDVWAGVREESGLARQVGQMSNELGDHAIQLEGLHQGYTGLREILDRLIDRVSAVAESAQAGDGMMREDLIGRIEAIEERLADVGELPPGETLVMSPEESELTRSELIARGVPCHLCGAVPGDPCKTAAGEVMEFSHTTRVQIARNAADAHA